MLVSLSMQFGTRSSVVSYMTALKGQTRNANNDGGVASCPRTLAVGLLDSFLRWESICRRAVELLATYEYEVRGEDPREMMAEAEEVTLEIMMELGHLIGDGESSCDPEERGIL